MEEQPNNPLHGVTLENILVALEAHYGWEYMGHQITIKCFTNNPSVKSSLKFLRRTPWARNKVEAMYVNMLKKQQHKKT
ncbi:VF530 family DNA-binding protein [Bizionia sediminis]|uniref:VF530 family DNA-binding protein n=1 Tax=Bizionia sediminis TaxID=1737064 RepID=A0ABW5KVA5_9FLAO